MIRENVEYLQNLGLTGYQSKALVILMAKQEATAEEICRYSGIPMTKIYSVLKSLEDKELVTFSPGKPRIFRCDEAAKIINALLEKLDSKFEFLKNEKRRQLKKIREIDWKIIAEQNHKERTHPMFKVGAEMPS